VDVVCFGQQNWDFCWTGKQHLVTRLAQRGHRVLYVDPDLDPSTRARDVLRSLAPLASGLDLREVAPRAWVFTGHYSPALRWRLSVRRYPYELVACLRRLGLERAVCLTLHPSALPHTLHPPFAARVHYAIDEMTAYGGIPEADKPAIRAREEELVRRSHVALAISPRLQARLCTLQPRCYLLPSGADCAHFEPARAATLPPPPDLAALPRPVLGVVGQLDERVDQALVATLARRLPHASLALVGRVKQGVDFSALADCANVHWLGFQPFSVLPRWLQGMDVCLVPYRLDELTHACSPLKVYEYLAAGRPVVATALDGLLEDCRRVVDVAPTADAFVAAVERRLADPGAQRAERLACAAANDWDQRVEELERRLEEALAVAGDTASRRAAWPGC
jgi:glycosyltransferase involved in cell wall biosynthesis